MTRFPSSLRAGALALMSASSLAAQKPPAVRALGPVTRVSTAPLTSIASVAALSDGRVYANDIVSRRVVLFDSTLATMRVVADSTAATSNAYGARPGALIAWRMDTVLFVDPASASMPVLGPSGTIVRVMAAPRGPAGAPVAAGLVTSYPGFDPTGRMIFNAPVAPRPPAPAPGRQAGPTLDSLLLVRYDMATRSFDTVGAFRGPKPKIFVTYDDDLRTTALEMTQDFFPLVDDWAVTPDGTIALVRGRDYHVDWFGADGKWRSTPKMAFDWQRLDDAQKTTLIDSGMTVIKARRDSMTAAINARGGVGLPADGAGARGGGRSGGGGGGPPGPPPAMIDGRPGLADLPDYRPAFGQRAVRADADGNLWIRTSIVIDGQPVYDIVNRRGEVTDRVQLPTFRTIAGFGPGVVYLAVKDAAGVVHLERARFK
jgi:hypothetical protein